MAYSASNLTQLSHGAGFQLWVYKSADAIATVNTANYFADAAPMLSVRDLMIVVDTATPTTSFVSVLSNDGVSVVDVSDGTAVAETDSD
jgi:hypothetical protein